MDAAAIINQNQQIFDAWVDNASLSLDSIAVYRYMWSSISSAAGGSEVIQEDIDGLAQIVELSTAGKSSAYRRRVSQLLSRVILFSDPDHPASALPAMFPQERRQPQPEVIQGNQRDQIRKLIEVTSDDWKIVRDIAMVAITLGSGIKLHELVNLQRNDVLETLGNYDFRIRGARARISPLSPNANPHLKAWLDVIDREREKAGLQQGDLALFIGTMSRKGLQEKISKITAYRAFRLMLSRAGIDQGASSKLRHTFGQNQVEVGVDAATVANWMGLFSVETVARYQRNKRPV